MSLNIHHRLVTFFIVSFFVIFDVNAGSYYVATTGSDSSGNGSSTSPWKTIGKGINGLSAGDTLIVKNGTYYDMPNFINTREHDIPNGTASNNPTIIRAETPFGVRIENTGSLNYYDNPLHLGSSKRFIKVDGFIFNIKNTIYPSNNSEISGDYNRITRCIFRREGPMDQYGGWMVMGGDNNLVEDSAGVGSSRYGFMIGGPSSSSQKNIFRRVVGRVDYTDSRQPKATFSVYGNNNTLDVKDHIFQNCIAVDSQAGPTDLGAANYTWGAWYLPKNATNVTITGSIALNVESHLAGFYLKELSGNNVTLHNSIAWGIRGPAGHPIALPGFKLNGGSGPSLIDHITVGDSDTGYDNSNGTGDVLVDSAFINNGAASSNGSGNPWDIINNNAFIDQSHKHGTSPLDVDSLPTHLIDTSTTASLNSTATDGSHVGATILHAVGVTGTLWGEPGYDQQTTESLWPWPYEDEIKAVFAETNNSPSGVTPSTNNTRRGFAANVDSFGKSMTLTRYIWQQLGNAIPENIYNQVEIPAPSNVNIIKNIQP